MALSLAHKSLNDVKCSMPSSEVILLEAMSKIFRFFKFSSPCEIYLMKVQQVQPLAVSLLKGPLLGALCVIKEQIDKKNWVHRENKKRNGACCPTVLSSVGW